MKTKKSIKIFISYSHKDKEYKEKFCDHLKELELLYHIDVWHDGKIDAGGNIDEKVLENLNTSDIVLLLVSPNFLTSKYCYGIELKNAIKRHMKNECIVVPVILAKTAVINDDLPFSKLKRVPEDGKPIKSFRSHSDGYVDAVNMIKCMIDSTFQFVGNDEDNQNVLKEDGRSNRQGTKKKNAINDKSSVSDMTYNIFQDGNESSIVIDKDLWRCIKEINHRLIDFNKVINERLIDVVADYRGKLPNAKKIYDMHDYRVETLRLFSLEICVAIREWLFHNIGVRIHFRILNKQKNMYVGFVVVDGKAAKKSMGIAYSRRITPISCSKGMIYHSNRLHKPLIKSLNMQYHERGKHDDKYVDYFTSALRMEELDNKSSKALMSFGISIEKDYKNDYSRYLMALAFFDFDKIIENLMILFCKQLSNVDKGFIVTDLL